MTNFYIDLHGCAKNQTDAEILVSFLEKEGFCHTRNPEEADFILINSCGFIKSAKEESINAVYDVRATYPKSKIILTGCLAERYAEQLFESMPELDGVFGNGNLAEIAGFMKKFSDDNDDAAGKNGKKATDEQNRFVETFPQTGICAVERNSIFNYSGSVYVKITEGCSNHCSFCAIPLIRGELRSRTVEAVVSEIKGLVQKGVYEINLIGQDIAAYGTGLENDDVRIRSEAEKNGLSPIAYLISKIAEIEGDFIIRPLYIHPDHFKLDILTEMKKDSRFVPYFDIPFQSGDDKIIRMMNRTGSSEEYAGLVRMIREFFPEAVIRTTFLTGFPGETEEAAENTAVFLKEIAPDWSGCFIYSREEDTPAYKMKPVVPAKTARKRAAALEKLQTEITAQKLQKYVGRKLTVLIEEIINVDEKNADDCDEGLAIGRAWFQAPDVDGCVVVRYDRSDTREADLISPGNVVETEIIAVTGFDLDSRLCTLKKSNRSLIKFLV